MVIDVTPILRNFLFYKWETIISIFVSSIQIVDK